jgi:hypothetical protein
LRATLMWDGPSRTAVVGSGHAVVDRPRYASVKSVSRSGNVAPGFVQQTGTRHHEGRTFAACSPF